MLLRQVSHVGRMRELQIDDRIFSIELHLDYKCGADIVHIPIRSGQRLCGPVGGTPKKLSGFVLDFRRIELKHLMIVRLDE